MSSRRKCVFAAAVAIAAVAGLWQLAPLRAEGEDSASASAQCGATEKAKTVMAAISEGSLDKTFDIISRQSIIPEGQMKEMRRFSAEARNSVAEVIGKTTGTELAQVRQIGDHVRQILIVELTTVSPVYWKLTYYKQPAGNWVITHVRWNIDRDEIPR